MLFLGYESAVQYWRAVRAGLVPFPVYSQVAAVDGEAHLRGEVLDSFPDLPIEEQHTPQILVSDKVLIHASDEIGYHLCKNALPKGSFRQHVCGVLVASPELTLLHAAHALKGKGFITLLELCCEFMGNYTLNDGERRGFDTCETLTTKSEVNDFIDKLPKWTRGKKLLRSAVELAGERSRSPRETECFLAMSLPPALGGYGLPAPELNHPSLSNDDGYTADEKAYLADLAWNDGKIIFEYDGFIDHTNHKDVLHDKERRSDLASRGALVIVATNESVADDGSFRKKVAQVFRALDLPQPRFTAKEMREQLGLHSVLFNPSHHYASPYITPITPKQMI